MKPLTKTSRVSAHLEKIFDLLNRDFFEGKLDRPIITIQYTRGTYGHYSTTDMWNVNGEGRREINIDASSLQKPIEFIVGVLLHEMVHYYNDAILGVQDCSRGGRYHNKHFKEVAETVGLVVGKTQSYGFCQTAPSEELIEWIISNEIADIPISRRELPEVKSKSKSSYRVYTCPQCETKVRATKAVNIRCDDCHTKMVDNADKVLDNLFSWVEQLISKQADAKNGQR